MIWWFARNQWSHPNFADLCDWALNEQGSVHPSQVSHIRQRKLRMIGLKVLDGFGQVNLAVHAYHTDRKLLTDLGVRPLTPAIESMVERAEAIMHPHFGRPMGQGDWMELFLGLFTIPGALEGSLDPSSELFATASSTVGKYVSRVMQAANIDLATANERIGNRIGRNKAEAVVMVAAQIRAISPEQFHEEISDYCEALKAIDGMDRTPEQLVKAVTEAS
ncbi:MAG: hypothetical protein ACPGSE_00085 [Synechococcus sp.]